MSEKPVARAASYLSPPDFHRLNWACRPIRHAFRTPPYLVGSALTRLDFRDIDIRLILDDAVVARMFGVRPARPMNNAVDVLVEEATRHLDAYDPDPGDVRLLLNIALSDLIAKAANAPAPIDFQIQSMTEANVPEHGMRNPLGIDRGAMPVLVGSRAI